MRYQPLLFPGARKPNLELPARRPAISPGAESRRVGGARRGCPPHVPRTRSRGRISRGGEWSRLFVRWPLFLLTLGALASLAGHAQADGSHRWPNGFTTLSTSTTGNITSSPAIGSDGTVYIGVQVGAASSSSPSGILFALRPDGVEKWRYTVPEWIDSTPALASDGTVYFGCWDGRLYALTPAGALKWSLSLGAFVASSPAIGTDETIYIGAGSTLAAVNADGTLKWLFPTEDWVDSSPALAPDGTIYAGSWDGYIYALAPNGTLKWRHATGGSIVASPALAASGTVYIGSRDAHVYALNPDGSLQWSFDTGDTVEASPVLGADGTVYAATTGGRVIALSPNGTERWRYPGAGQAALNAIYSTPAVRADGAIVFGSSNSAVYALRPDGTLLWQTPIGDWADSSAVVSPDGSIYIGATDKRVYALASAAGPSLTDWTQFRRDPQRTGWQPIGAVSGTSGRLINLSVRTVAGSDADTLIVGFVASGTRSLLVRGIGPTLANFGVPGVLADPRITAFSDTLALATNDTWGEAENAAAIASTGAGIGAFPLPAASLDAALLRDFPPGDYTVHVSGQGAATGVALVEVYDATASAGARVINVSARSAVGTDAGILIAGFVVGEAERTVLVRGIGPALAGFAVTGALADPQLRVYRNTQLLAENNDWGVAGNAAALAARAASMGAFPLPSGGRDAALLLTLPPGSYTAQISGVNATTGVALVEIYEVP